VNAPVRLRLTGWYVLVLAAVVTGLGAFVVTSLRADLTSALDRSLRSAAGQIAQGYQAEGAGDFRDVAHTVLPGPRDHGSGAQILDVSGPVAFSDGDPVVEAPVLTDGDLRRVSSGQKLLRDVRLGTPREHLRAIGLGVTRHGRRQVLVVVESLAAVDRAVHQVLVLLLLGSGAALAIVALGGWWIARKALRPVERMATLAERIGIAEIRDHRIAVPGVRDELSHLARTLNAMLDRLQNGVEAREQLIADASHELRAPLAATRSELEVSLRHDVLPEGARAVLSSARDEVVRMGWIVENLLTLARVDEGRLELLVAPQELREVAEAAVRTHRLAAEAAGVELVVEGDAGRVDGDRDRLQQVISNLLDNAIRLAPRGPPCAYCCGDLRPRRASPSPTTVPAYRPRTVTASSSASRDGIAPVHGLQGRGWDWRSARRSCARTAGESGSKVEHLAEARSRSRSGLRCRRPAQRPNLPHSASGSTSRLPQHGGGGDARDTSERGAERGAGSAQHHHDEDEQRSQREGEQRWWKGE
jgi:signal transduction histidine kinase